jgi:hypothetical protein
VTDFDLAPCREMPTVLFFDPPDNYKAALEACRSCPVRVACFDACMAQPTELEKWHGVWGGTLPSERRDDKVRARRIAECGRPEWSDQPRHPSTLGPVWCEPTSLAAPGRHHRWVHILEPVTERPGEWALVQTYDDALRARNHVRDLRRSVRAGDRVAVRVPPGDWEFRHGRMEDGTHGLWARWLGVGELVAS